MPVIVKLPRARLDLIELWDYIAEESETRADAFIDLIDEKFQILAGNPNMGRARREIEDDLRSFPVGRYVIFYRPTAKGIEIVRVLHGSRDLGSIFHPVD